MIKEEKKIKKTVIIAGYSCNNNCVFCINYAKRGQIPDKDGLQIKREMTEARFRGSAYVEIIGGEISIRPDIFDLVKFAKNLGFETIMMATNGRIYSYKDFARKILEAGLNSLVFSIHGHNVKLHDSLTQAPGSFRQLKKGIKNVKELIKELNLKISLGVNVCVVKQNYKYLPKIGKCIQELGINNAEFIFVDPNYGAAFRFFNKLVPKLSEAAPYIHKCLEIGKKEKFPYWHVRYVPLCYFQDYLEQISELHEVETFRTEHITPDFYNPDAAAGRKNIGRIKTEKCQKCQLFNKCEGIWREYFKHYGDRELKPIINIPGDLIIFSSALDFYLNSPRLLIKKIAFFGEQIPRTLNFQIFYEDFRGGIKKKTGKKIKKIINKLVKEDLGFYIHPPPPCLFNGIYPENIQNHILSEEGKFSVPRFINEGSSIKHAYSKEDIKIFNKTMYLDPECSCCELKSREKCRGIYSCGGSTLCTQRLEDWLHSKVNLLKNVILLDCGCGAKPPFLEFYKKISLTGMKIYLLDPDPEALTGLRPMVSDYHNIFIIENTAEKMDFKDIFFDVVILTGSYSHIQNLDRALSNIKRILKKDGLLLILDEAQLEGLKNFLKRSVNYEFHCRNHNLKQVVFELEKHHFKAVETSEEWIESRKSWAWSIKAKKT